MKVLKYVLVLILGLVIGAFGGEAFMKDVHQQKIVDIFTQNEISRVENFIKNRNLNDEVRYCLSYKAAKHDVYQLNKKIEAAENIEFRNDLVLNNIEDFKRVTNEFSSLKTEGLKYNCENI